MKGKEHSGNIKQKARTMLSSYLKYGSCDELKYEFYQNKFKFQTMKSNTITQKYKPNNNNKHNQKYVKSQK